MTFHSSPSFILGNYHFHTGHEISLILVSTFLKFNLVGIHNRNMLLDYWDPPNVEPMPLVCSHWNLVGVLILSTLMEILKCPPHPPLWYNWTKFYNTLHPSWLLTPKCVNPTRTLNCCFHPHFMNLLSQFLIITISDLPSYSHTLLSHYPWVQAASWLLTQ